MNSSRVGYLTLTVNNSFVELIFPAQSFAGNPPQAFGGERNINQKVYSTSDAQSKKMEELELIAKDISAKFRVKIRKLERLQKIQTIYYLEKELLKYKMKLRDEYGIR